MDNALVAPSFRLTLTAAHKMVHAALAAAQDMGVEICIAVVDGGGNLLAFARMDGGRVSAGPTAIAKARSAAFIGKETGGADFELGLQIAIANNGDWSNLKAGIPVMFHGSVIGGVGVGSATSEQDITIARAAVRALALDA